MLQKLKLRDAIRQLVKEVIEEEELEEASVTGNVDGYNIPGAFSDDEEDKGKKRPGYHGGRTATKEGGHRNPTVFDYTLVENRWLELKNDDSLNPVQKIGVGIRNLNHKLREIEDFTRWYKKIQQEHDLESDKHWRRTQKHVRTMKERIINIAKDIREIV